MAKLKLHGALLMSLLAIEVRPVPALRPLYDKEDVELTARNSLSARPNLIARFRCIWYQLHVVCDSNLIGTVGPAGKMK